MGYDVHIERSSGSEGGDMISLDEWKGYVANDPEMQMKVVAEITSPLGEVIRYENPGLAIWSPCSKDKSKYVGVWFDWRNGRIVVRYHDDIVISKMVQVAAKLSARVRGDEGEYYD